MWKWILYTFLFFYLIMTNQTPIEVFLCCFNSTIWRKIFLRFGFWFRAAISNIFWGRLIRIGVHKNEFQPWNNKLVRIFKHWEYLKKKKIEKSRISSKNKLNTTNSSRLWLRAIELTKLLSGSTYRKVSFYGFQDTLGSA